MYANGLRSNNTKDLTVNTESHLPYPSPPIVLLPWDTCSLFLFRVHLVVTSMFLNEMLIILQPQCFLLISYCIVAEDQLLDIPLLPPPPTFLSIGKSSLAELPWSLQLQRKQLTPISCSVSSRQYLFTLQLCKVRTGHSLLPFLPPPNLGQPVLYFYFLFRSYYCCLHLSKVDSKS